MQQFYTHLKWKSYSNAKNEVQKRVTEKNYLRQRERNREKDRRKREKERQDKESVRDTERWTVTCTLNS